VRSRQCGASVAAALALVIVVFAEAPAQRADPSAPLPLLLQAPERRPAAIARPPVTPVGPDVMGRVHRARLLREAGELEAARDSLTRLMSRYGHHPQFLIELARVHQDRGAWRALEQMARAERSAAHDSVLLASELVLALGHLGRPRDAAQVALEAWLQEPAMGDWSGEMLEQLAGAAPDPVREVLRRGLDSQPARGDVARCAARIEWRLGQGGTALKLLRAADRVGVGTPARWMFAEQMLARGVARDSLGAIEALLDLAADRSRDLAFRMPAARRAWLAYGRRGAEQEGAQRLQRSLADVAVEQWPDDLVVGVMRGLRSGGLTVQARALMKDLGGRAEASPELVLERALNELRDGPSDKALVALAAAAAVVPEGGFRYAEALFFAGRSDSALAWYQRVAADPRGVWTGAALERIYLIEDANPRAALAIFGRLAYEEWRGDHKRAVVLADSLYRTLPHGALWAHAALALAAHREATGAGKEALEPLLAIADGLPEDRLAPLARQRAGDVLRLWHKDDARALAQYEECLARYPKAWNAPEVRRMVEILRRERRF
jgi:tetratricopeptide (TPR) repeat protein